MGAPRSGDHRLARLRSVAERNAGLEPAEAALGVSSLLRWLLLHGLNPGTSLQRLGDLAVVAPFAPDPTGGLEPPAKTASRSSATAKFCRAASTSGGRAERTSTARGRRGTLLRVEPETHALFPQLPFRAMRGMRNIIAHDYGDVDLDQVWQTASHDLQPLIEALEVFFAQGKM
ncbi:MAG: DUF86 domain-containing protein [Chthoniobacteraceae bacterium]